MPYCYSVDWGVGAGGYYTTSGTITAATSGHAANTITVTTTASQTSATWLVWASQQLYPATSQTSVNATWDAWTTQMVRVQLAATAVLTPEQQAARAAEQELQRQAYETRRAAEAETRRVAIIKADKLLESILTEVQRAHVQAHGYFVVKGRSGQLYRIRRGWSANVDVLDKKGNVVERLCAHPSSYMPDGDLMAAQKLMLETADEQEFLRIAIKHGRSNERVPSEVLERMVA